MAFGWNLWVWLVSVVVRRYIIDILIIITFPYSTLLALFFAACIIPISLFCFKVFFRSCYIYFCELFASFSDLCKCATRFHFALYVCMYLSVTLGPWGVPSDIIRKSRARVAW